MDDTRAVLEALREQPSRPPLPMADVRRRARNHRRARRLAQAGVAAAVAVGAVGAASLLQPGGEQLTPAPAASVGTGPAAPALGVPDPATGDVPVPAAESSSVAVPDVVGLSEVAAAKALASAGLNPAVVYVAPAGSATDGTIRATDPPPGAAVTAGAVVEMEVAAVPDTEIDADRPGLRAISDLVAGNHDAFVGMYLEADDSAVLVLGRGARPADWRAHVDAALQLDGAPVGVTFATCDVTRAELDAVAAAIADRTWTTRDELPLVFRIDARACRVVIAAAELTEAEIGALSGRHGDLVAFDRSAAASPWVQP